MINNKIQQILPLELREARNRKDFVVGKSNQEAVKWIDKFPKWSGNGLIIVGPRASGKSHLTFVWQKKSHCDIVNYKEVDSESKKLLNFKNLAIENIHKITNFKFLLHVFNIKKERKLNLLLTSRLSINKLSIALQDIRSRLIALPQANILLPTDDIIKGTLLKLFRDKGIFLSTDLVNYIFIRIERTHSSVTRFVNEVDKLSLREKKNITIPLIKKIIQNK